MPRPSAEPNTAVVSDSKLQRDIEVARRNQERLQKTLPNSFGKAIPEFDDPRNEIARRLIPEAFGEKPSMSAYFDDPANHRRHIQEGWEPVLEDGEHARHGNDLLYKRPRSISLAHIRKAEAISEARLRSTPDDLNEARRVDPDAVIPDSTSVRRGSLPGIDDQSSEG